jgi:23S rRNA pseudouridine1911/1915/1917 synthase
VPEKRVNVTIEPSDAGRTVAAMLRVAAGVSNSLARGIVAAGRVTRNGAPVADPAARVAAGDVIAARFDPGTRYAAPSRPRDVGFRTVLEDKSFVVVDKPAGVLTVPVPESGEETLVERVEGSLQGRGIRWPTIRVVHRIDRATSGLVLVARTPAARAELVRQFSRRQPLRQYLAVCEGRIDPPEGKMVSRLVEHPKSHKVRPTSDPREGQEAISHYRTVETFADATLVRVRLETGRHNQIRVQFAERGRPLVGDVTYGRPSRLIRRVALHAERLAFDHPTTGRRVDVTTPPPADFARLLDRLRAGARVSGGDRHRQRVS